MLQRPAILITDDDDSFRETLRFALEPRGYETLVAEDGAEALRIVQQKDVDLLLLDMHMPRFTGIETLRLVREVKSQLPCILMSAKLDEDIRRQAQEANIFSVMAKPVELLDLNRTVKLALRATYGW